MNIEIQNNERKSIMTDCDRQLAQILNIKGEDLTEKINDVN